MHETGFKSGLTRVLNDYARKYKLLKAVSYTHLDVYKRQAKSLTRCI